MKFLILISNYFPFVIYSRESSYACWELRFSKRDEDDDDKSGMWKSASAVVQLLK